MRKGVAIVALLLFGVVAARAETLSFDHVTTAESAQIPDGYGGLQWSYVDVLDTSSPPYNDSGYPNGLVSGAYVAYNGGGHLASISGTPFTFDSAYFCAAWNDGLNITVTGFISGVQVDQARFVVDTHSTVLETFDWAGIDTLRIASSGGTPAGYSSGGGTNFVMDDFTFEPTAVPLPSALSGGILLLGPLGMLTLASRALIPPSERPPDDSQTPKRGLVGMLLTCPARRDLPLAMHGVNL